jgi:hypothetical protein
VAGIKVGGTIARVVATSVVAASPGIRNGVADALGVPAVAGGNAVEDPSP